MWALLTWGYMLDLWNEFIPAGRISPGYWTENKLIQTSASEGDQCAHFDYKIEYTIYINLACLSVCLFVSNKRQNG